MSSEVLPCFEDQPVENVAKIMSEHGVRRLPVLDRRGRLTGVVSSSDVKGGALRKNKPYAVTFYKHQTDGRGTLHEVPIRTVYVAAVDGEDEAVTVATAVFKRHWGPARWEGAADGCWVDGGPLKPDFEREAVLARRSNDRARQQLRLAPRRGGEVLSPT
jgi:hypothetical protein